MTIGSVGEPGQAFGSRAQSSLAMAQQILERQKRRIILEERVFSANHESRSHLMAMPHRPAFARLISTKQRDSAMQKKTWKCIVILHLGMLALVGMSLGIDANAQQPERQDFGSGGLFSYVPPSGWEVSDFSGTQSKGAKYKVSHGAPVNGAELNIVVLDEVHSGSLDDYVKASKKLMQKKYQSESLDQTDFMTSGGTRAVKVVFERDLSEKQRMRQVSYFFDAGNKKLAVACAGLAERASELNQVCDACMKTFRVAPNPK